MLYYPETTVIQRFVEIVRERRLPPHAASEGPQVVVNEPVDAVQPVIVGDILGDFRIFDVAQALKLKDSSPETIQKCLLTEVGARVQLGQELARSGRGRRAKTLNAPVEGKVAAIEGNRIILQEATQTVEVKARIPGEVSALTLDSVTVSGKGVLIQCAWGNGGYAFRAFKFLPPDGFAALSKVDPRISEYRNAVIVSENPLNAADLTVANQQDVAGVVAPSMPVALRQLALQCPFPVLLTEGFGQRRPSELIYRLLRDNMGLQVVFDAAVPDRWTADRPEIMIPLPSKGQTPLPPVLDQALGPEMQVRLTRAPWDGLVGVVKELPQAPQVIENGLRVPCASVQLEDGPRVLVPLANLELLG